MSSKDKDIDPAKLPESGPFTKKEVDQYPQPADTGLPIKGKQQLDGSLAGKHADRSSREEGLNEANSTGNAGAFEGFEDPSKEK